MAKRKSKQPERGDEVHVEWHDAVTRPGWHDDTPFTLLPVVSTGFLIADEKDRITLASDLNCASGVTARIQSIPKGCIKQIKVREKQAVSRAFFLRTDKEVKQ